MTLREAARLYQEALEASRVTDQQEEAEQILQQATRALEVAWLEQIKETT